MMWKPNDDKWGPTGIFDLEYKKKEVLAQVNPNVKRNFNAIIGSLAGKQIQRKRRGDDNEESHRQYLAGRC